jgi:flagellar M-ring protein FliF
VAFLDLAAGLPRNAFERVRSFANGQQRARLIAGIAIMASIVIPAILWSSGTSYSVLFAGLSGEEGGRAIAELQKLNVPYRITDGGRVILVPEADVGFARLQLAARGIPKQDGDQWALFDNESLGVSPFAEQVHYTRAIETALAHTVRDVDGVVSATVKLALPKESDFLTDAPKPSAAVMIRLRPGVQLTTAQIDGVVGLVAAGVPGLSRDNVTLVDQSGKVLNSDDKDGLQQVPRQLEIAQAIAHQYETMIIDLLVPVLGRGNFRVSADADIDFSQWQESSVKYGDSHILSEDAASHFRASNSEQAIGIPGALSNRPPETPTVSALPAAGQTGAVPAPTTTPAASEPEQPPKEPPPDTHRTTNYDIDRTVQALEHPSWKLRAINIDVLVNNPSRNPIPAQRIQAINKLVSAAIGSGENRHIAVVDLPFAEEGSGAGDANPTWWRQRWMTTVTQNALLVIAGLLVLLGGVLPLLRYMRVNLASQSGHRDGAFVFEPANSDARDRAEPSIAAVAAVGNAPRIDPDTVRTLVANDPARTAEVIKEWIARDRSSLRRAS